VGGGLGEGMGCGRGGNGEVVARREVEGYSVFARACFYNSRTDCTSKIPMIPR